MGGESRSEEGNAPRRPAKVDGLVRILGHWPKCYRGWRAPPIPAQHASPLRFRRRIQNDGNRVINARRLTTDDHSNVPFAWTPDSRRVILLSRRTQVLQVYSQALEGSTPPQLVTPAPTIDFDNVRLAPDGTWLVALGQPRGSSKENFYRVAIGGGVPQLMFVPETGTDGDFRCTNQRANFCVYALRTPHQNELILKSFDLMSGMGKEILRIPVDPGADNHWALSPAGSQVGILKSGWDSDQIRFFQVHGGRTRSISIKGYSQLRSLDWAPDSLLPMAATSLCSAPARRRTSGALTPFDPA